MNIGLQTEQAVLGGVLLRDNIALDIVDMLTAEAFQDSRHKLIYSAIVSMIHENVKVDLVGVANKLKEQGLLASSGDIKYLSEIAQSTISAVHTMQYATTLKDRHDKSNLLASLESAKEDLIRSSDTKQAIDDIELAILSMREGRSSEEPKEQKSLLMSVFDRIEKRSTGGISGISYGYKDLDTFTGGLNAGELTILSARPSMGKTAFALNIANNIASSGKRVLFYSLEMTAEDITQRLLCLRAGVALHKVRNGGLEGQDMQRLSHAEEAQSKLPLLIDDTPRGLTTLDIRSKSRRASLRGGVDIIIVDYLQLMKSSQRFNGREQEVADISRSLKALSKELNVPVLALAQLSRGLEQRTDKRPMLSDLRESGAIEQDADVVMFIHREDMYRKGEEHPKKGMADIIIGKNRNGATGDVELRYRGSTTKFEEK